MDNKKELLKQIPKIDEVLRDQHLFVLLKSTARGLVVESVRDVIDEFRGQILKWQGNEPLTLNYDSMIDRIVAKINNKKQKSLRPVINGTGTILHTNLGRARLSMDTCKSVAEAAASYSTLEYDLNQGARGSRHNHIEKLINKIIGTEAAMAVNNNAAAVLLCLSSLANGKDVIVSRGELVEIGGSFRIPEIMKQGGANLTEVGTTNKTTIDDYRNAILDDRTGVLLKVHTSNYKIMGFTAEASLKELVQLGNETGIPVVYDIGSGLMVNLQQYGVDEPTVLESLKSGIDVILFSGDKLLGGPQAGIIAGKKKYIDKLKKHPLARVVRLDKMTLAALEATFREYLDMEKVKETIPTLSMITISIEDIRKKAEQLAIMIERSTEAFIVKVVESLDQIGGGSTPNLFMPGYAVSIKGKDIPLDWIERNLRRYEVPIIVRINHDQILINLRTVNEDELEKVVEALIYVGQKPFHCESKFLDGGNEDA